MAYLLLIQMTVYSLCNTYDFARFPPRFLGWVFFALEFCFL